MLGGNTNSLQSVPIPSDAEIFMQTVMEVRTQSSAGDKRPERGFGDVDHWLSR